MGQSDGGSGRGKERGKERGGGGEEGWMRKKGKLQISDFLILMTFKDFIFRLLDKAPVLGDVLLSCSNRTSDRQLKKVHIRALGQSEFPLNTEQRLRSALHDSSRNGTTCGQRFDLDSNCDWPALRHFRQCAIRGSYVSLHMLHL